MSRARTQYGWGFVFPSTVESWTDKSGADYTRAKAEAIVRASNGTARLLAREVSASRVVSIR